MNKFISEPPMDDHEGFSTVEQPKPEFSCTRKPIPDPPEDNAAGFSNFGQPTSVFSFRRFIFEPPVDSDEGSSMVDQPEPGSVMHPTKKTLPCRHYFSASGCRNGEKCSFAHGDCEYNEPFYIPLKDNAQVFRPIYSSHIKSPLDPFRFALYTIMAYPYIRPDQLGVIFGEKRELLQWICNLTGVKIVVEDNEEDPSFKKIILSGSIKCVYDSMQLVDALLKNFFSISADGKIPPVVEYKTKICKNYAKKGFCKNAETCVFAHGDSELRPSAVEILQRTMEEIRTPKRRK
ncbi:unnamed protein product [Cuscuta epithymum]|uniref:C3H1-type domain-containing protein n=1 Tax=Cuscuta epithymum TaxID=186058 RepID=A0AAV0C0C1_9ASTE|nr:unnamed protein product [Cuscuta epithymum]